MLAVTIYFKFKASPLSPNIRKPDFLTFLLKFTLSFKVFRACTRSRFSKHKKHGHCPCLLASAAQVAVRYFPQTLWGYTEKGASKCRSVPSLMSLWERSLMACVWITVLL
jgi:hypothetical protein